MTETDAHYKAPAVAGYPDVPYAEKERLFEQVRSDIRFGDYLYGCYECGICVAACPSARFYDFSPRRIAQAAAREDVELVYQQMQEDIWECSQCFSCLRCPRGNNPGGLITIMREVAVSNGLASAKEALKGYSRIIYKIMSTGTQVSPDMLQQDAFPDWGPETADVSGQPRPVAPGAAPGDAAHHDHRLGGCRPDADRALPDLAAHRRPRPDRGRRPGPARDPPGADGGAPRGGRD